MCQAFIFSCFDFVCVEYSVIIKKLKNLVPVLVNCFQDFLPVLHDSLDAQSFDCMLNILRSLDHAVTFFIHGVQQGHPEPPPLDQSFSSVLLKKLLVVFPLSPMHHLSEKVWLCFQLYLLCLVEKNGKGCKTKGPYCQIDLYMHWMITLLQCLVH